MQLSVLKVDDSIGCGNWLLYCIDLSHSCEYSILAPVNRDSSLMMDQLSVWVSFDLLGDSLHCHGLCCDYEMVPRVHLTEQFRF